MADLFELNINRNNSSNIKFILRKSSNIIMEKYTDSNGSTDSFEIEEGEYIIDISKDHSDIGNIKINIS